MFFHGDWLNHVQYIRKKKKIMRDKNLDYYELMYDSKSILKNLPIAKIISKENNFISVEHASDTVNPSADAAREKVKILAAASADSPAWVKEIFANIEPSSDPTPDCAPKLDDKFPDPVNVSSPGSTSIEYFSADDASDDDVITVAKVISNENNFISAKDSSDDVPSELPAPVDGLISDPKDKDDMPVPDLQVKKDLNDPINEPSTSPVSNSLEDIPATATNSPGTSSDPSPNMTSVDDFSMD